MRRWEVSKRWFRIADTYGAGIASGQNAVLLLAVAGVTDSMAHEAGQRFDRSLEDLS